MNVPHPAAALLYLASLSVLLLTPVVAWLLAGERRDSSARWWFGGCLMFALAGLVFVLRLILPDAVTSWLGVALVIACLLMMGESLRRELDDPPREGLPRIAFAVLAAATCAVLTAAGLRQAYGADVELLTYALLETSLLWQIRRLRQRVATRGLLVVALGFSLVIVLNFARVAVSQSSGQHVTLLAYTPLSNAAFTANFLAIVMASFGFLGYLLEKSKRRELAEAAARAGAEAMEAAQRQRADELAEVVRQRDEMLLMNSRFSALSSLASMNASLVHEISQPLQALSAVIEGHEIDLQREGANLPPAIGHARAQVHRMSAVLASLRNLIAAQKPELERLALLRTAQEILPILESEATARGVKIGLTHTAEAAGVHVDASRVMLQRVIFNLVTNAFEALDAPSRAKDPLRAPQVIIDLGVRHIHAADHAVLRVRDNGPGLPQDMVGQAFEPFRTGRDGGTGLGLALARLLLETWGGFIEARNADGGGACVEIFLPVRSPD